MKIKIRSKPGGALVVLDEHDKPVEGVLAVSMTAKPGDAPTVLLTIAPATVVVDAEAEVLAPVTDPVVPMPSPGRSDKPKEKGKSE